MEEYNFKRTQRNLLILGLFFIGWIAFVKYNGETEYTNTYLEYCILIDSIFLTGLSYYLSPGLKSLNILLVLGFIIFLLTFIRSYNIGSFFFMLFIMNEFSRVNYNFTSKDIFWKLEEWYNKRTT